MTALNVPTDEPLRISVDHTAGQGGYVSTDGTLVVSMTTWEPGTVDVWVIARGNGPTLVKLGAGLNDYKVIAVCSVDVR